MKYQVIYISGGGTEYQDGVWEVKRTPKTIMAEKVEHFMTGVFANHEVGDKIRIGSGTGNPIKHEEEDGSFTVYFQQTGTPYIFTPLDTN